MIELLVDGGNVLQPLIDFTVTFLTFLGNFFLSMAEIVKGFGS